MERIICIFLLIVTQSAFAAQEAPAIDPDLSHLLTSIETQQQVSDTLKLSDFAIEKLQTKQIEFIQYFADDEVSQVEKAAVIDNYKSLNELLNKLGRSHINAQADDQVFEPGSGNGIIRGFVRSQQNESPLNQAEIRLYDSQGAYLRLSRTDSTGRYFFTGLEDGQYYVSASSNANYVTEFYPNFSCPGGLGQGCQPAELTTINLVDGNTTEQLDFSLSKEGKVTGRLLDQISNQPIRGTISLYDAAYNVIYSTQSSYNDGEFVIHLPSENAHYLTFNSNSHQKKAYDNIFCHQGSCDLNGATAIYLNNSDELDLSDILLNKYNQINGLIKNNQTGVAPSSMGRVEILDLEGNFVALSDNPQSNGSWSSGPIPAGSYRLRTFAIGYLAQYYQNQNCNSGSFNSCKDIDGDIVSHNDTGDLNGINFNLQPGGTIRGHSYDSESIGTRARVDLYDETGYQIASKNSDYQDGQFEFNGLGDGTYYISAVNNDHQNTLHPSILCTNIEPFSVGCATATDGNPIVVSASNTVIKHVRMRVGAYVSGRVSDTNNQPITNAFVRLFSNENSLYTYTDSDGKYFFDNVKADSYRLTSYTNEHAIVHWPNYVCTNRSDCDETQGGLITVNGSNAYNNINLKLPKLGKISLNVKNRSNQAADGRVSAYDSNNRLIETENLDSSGQSTFNLYPGNYHFVYDSRYSDYLNRVYGSNQNCYENCLPNSGTTVNTNYNQNRNINMTVDDAFILSGSINGQAPINNNWKYIKIYQNDVLVQSRKIHSNSQYEEAIKLPGSIKIEATQEGHFSSFYQGVVCYGEACGLSQATAVNVVPNQSRNIDFNLNMLSHIKGQIVNSDNEPLAGIQVEAFRLNRYAEYSDITDENGRYELYGLSPSSYNIRALTDGNYESTLYGNLPCPSQCQFDESNAIEIEAGDFFNDRNITMTQRGTLKIVAAKYVNGDVAAGVQIQFYKQGSNSIYPTATAYLDENGSMNEILLPSDSYRILARDGVYNNYLTTAYPNILCDQNSNNSCLSLSPTFQVNPENSHVINDFKINQKAQLSIQVIDENDSSPISGAQVEIRTPELALVKQTNSVNGLATIKLVNSGSYYIFIDTDFDDYHQSELYENISCDRGIGIDCLLSQGNSVDFNLNQVQSLTVALKRKPTLAVNLTNAYNGEFIEGNIRIYNTLGQQLVDIPSSSPLTIPMSEGEYYVVGNASYYNSKAYPNAYCQYSNDLTSCELNAATTITVTDQDQAINLGLDLIEGINGRVTNAYTGEPIEGVVIDFWRSQNYIHASTVTNQNGQFSKQLNDYYDYLISTDIPSELNLYNEVYNNKKCFEGPAVIDMCEPGIGERIEIDDSSQVPQVIEFKLDGDPIFTGRFEIE